MRFLILLGADVSPTWMIFCWVGRRVCIEHSCRTTKLKTTWNLQKFDQKIMLSFLVFRICLCLIPWDEAKILHYCERKLFCCVKVLDWSAEEWVLIQFYVEFLVCQTQARLLVAVVLFPARKMGRKIPSFCPLEI